MPRPALLTTPSPKPLLSEIKAPRGGTDQSSADGWAKDARRRRRPTCHVGVAVVVQAAPGHRLAAKQRVAVKVVAELFQEAEDVRDAADGGQSQGVLLLVEVGWAGTEDAVGQVSDFQFQQSPAPMWRTAREKSPHLR